jgi:uncharacterized membrane protein
MLIASVRRLAAACRVAVRKGSGFGLQVRWGFAEAWEREAVLEKLRSDIEEMKVKVEGQNENLGYF